MGGLIALLSCTGPTPADEAPLLPADALLVRWSLDARGVRPSADELAAVRANPAAVEAYLDEYLADPRFGDRVWTALSPAWLTRADESDSADTTYSMDDEAGFVAAMGEEPLRLIGHVANEDLPYTDIVTADWTMVNEQLAAWYPTDYPDGGVGWQVARWTDHRPAAGVLATNGLWWRYPTTTGNANRGRANAIGRILLCSDTTERSIELDANADLTDADAVADAVSNNPSCVACHTSIDPLGSYLWGFYVEFSTNPADITHYHPERERLWQTFGGGVAPAFYGAPGSTLADLGRQIAADPRFPTCAVEQTTEILLQRPVAYADTDALAAHREAFIQGGGTVRALWRAVMSSAEYRTLPVSDPEGTTWKMVTPDQYVTQLTDLTGWTFTAGGADVFAEDRYGLRSMAGGGRAVFGTGAGLDPTPTMTLVHQRLAEAAAAHVTATDHADPGAARLFEAADFDATTPAEARVRALVLRVLSRDATDEEIATLSTLWTELYTTEEGAEGAWAGVLATLFRHPDFLFY
ncbi:MAG: DUF1592 domain-containing protein [Myxococcota bacterium]